jgi:hypothetical protein
VDEGSAGGVSFSDQSDPSTADTAAGFTYSYDFDNDGTFEVTNSASASAVVPGTFLAENPGGTVRGRISDKDGGFTDYTTVIPVNNVAPAVGAITAPADPTLVNTTVNASAGFTDPGVLDTHTAVWDWGDGSTSAGSVNESGGSGSVTGSHAYTASGVYTVTLTVTDDDGDSGQSVFQYVVVYDPGAGFVTGGGWFNSPAGAYKDDPSLTGKANFGFVSKYHNGVPTGQTQFQFKAGNLNFHSSSYDWLVVGGHKAQYRGTGTINGSGSYKFMLTVIDGQQPGGGGVDRIRIRIWGESGVVYDNKVGGDQSDTADPDTVLGGGSIVIHK